MNNGWREECFCSIDEIFTKFIEFRTSSRRWAFRGVSKDYDNPLLSSFDRITSNITDRKTKINLERQSIELFRSTYTQLLIDDDRKYLGRDNLTLMLMQHYGAPTRFLDWSFSPYIAAYFAVSSNKDSDGYIWAFDYDRYKELGPKQWYDFPEMNEGSNFDTLNPAFCLDYPAYNKEFKDEYWIICQHIAHFFSFNRIRNQDGFFTFASQFNIDHATALKHLLQGEEFYRVYKIKSEDKVPLWKELKENFNITHGLIYPDIVGAAESVKENLEFSLVQ